MKAVVILSTTDILSLFWAKGWMWADACLNHNRRNITQKLAYQKVLKKKQVMRSIIWPTPRTLQNYTVINNYTICKLLASVLLILAVSYSTVNMRIGQK